MVGSRRAAARRRRAPDVAGRRDAIVAANHLVPVLARLVPEAPDRIAARAAAVAAIEAERRPEIEAIQAMQTRQTKMFERGYTPLRAALFRLMLRVGPLLRSWSRRRTVFGRTSPWSNCGCDCRRVHERRAVRRKPSAAASERDSRAANRSPTVRSHSSGCRSGAEGSTS